MRTVRSVKTAVFRVLSNPEDYRYRAQIMWGGTLARNALRKVFAMRALVFGRIFVTLHRISKNAN